MKRLAPTGEVAGRFTCETRRHSHGSATSLGNWRGNGTVLVVDDEPSVRRVCRLMLQKFDFTVLTAADGERGLETFAEHRADIRLVILDLMLPRSSGADVLTGLRAVDPAVPVIVVSGYGEIEATACLPPSESVEFVHKPFRMETLMTAVRAAVGA